MFHIFPDKNADNKLIGFMGQSTDKPFAVISSNLIPDLNCISPASGGTQCLPLYRYDENGDRIENITDWALERFRERYLPSPPALLPQERGARLADADLARLAGARRDIPEVLLQKAKELRQKQTPAEQMLWQCLRANQLHGAKFRRQHNIGQYIVDFYCHAAKLVIELDGGIHELQKDRDSDRDAYLEANGLQVLRLKNEEIIQNLPKIFQTISQFLFLPSPAGEGQGVRADNARGRGARGEGRLSCYGRDEGRYSCVRDNYQTRHLPLHLRRPSTSSLPNQIRTQPQTRISSTSLLRRLPSMGIMGQSANGLTPQLRNHRTIRTTTSRNCHQRQPQSQAQSR